MPCSPGMRKCSTSCLHRQLVMDYRLERQHQEIAAEDDWRNRDGNEHAPKLITFKDWIVGRRRYEQTDV